MAELFLKDIPGFSETADTITIAKSALGYTGYVPRAVMTAEEFTLAFTKKMGGIFTEAAQEADPDRQIVIEMPGDNDYSLSGTAPDRYAEFEYAITLRKPAPTVTISPLDF